MSQLSIGRIVHYRLNAGDAQIINRLRADGTTSGNYAREGDVYPAMVVRLFDPNATTVNLQVFLDGNDTYWATSRTESDEAGHWFWPPRV